MFGLELLGEVLRLEDLTNLDFPLFARHGVWKAFGPIDCFLKRLTFPQPKTCDQLLGFRKWTIGHDSFPSRELDSGAFRARLQSFPGEHYAGLGQFVVELAHLGEKLRARHLARLGILAGFDDYQESHFDVSFRSIGFPLIKLSRRTVLFWNSPPRVA